MTPIKSPGEFIDFCIDAHEIGPLSFLMDIFDDGQHQKLMTFAPWFFPSSAGDPSGWGFRPAGIVTDDSMEASENYRRCRHGRRGNPVMAVLKSWDLHAERTVTAKLNQIRDAADAGVDPVELERIMGPPGDFR